MQSETKFPDASNAPLQGLDTRICPKCKQETKRVSIEITEHDWLGIIFAGIWAAAFPARYRALVCEHCGTTFERTELQNRTANRAIGFAILFISMAIAIGVVVLIVWGMLPASK